MEKSYGLQREHLLWFSFLELSCLWEGKKTTAVFPPGLKINLFLQTTSQVLAVRINLHCVPWSSSQLCFVSSPLIRAEAVLECRAVV